MRRLGSVLALAASSPPGAATSRVPAASTPATNAPAPGTDCGDVSVTGHEALGIRAGAVDCDSARAVAAAAEGRGRQPYEAEGFRCEPADADAGDTDYTCTRGKVRISFRYGTA